MQKKIVKAVFIIPFYDGNDITSELLDTIESVRYHLGGSCPVICINDCQKKENIDFFTAKCKELENVVNFLPLYGTDWPRNAYGPLFCKIYQGVEEALRLYRFDYLIKIDADALVTGSSIIEYVERYFKANHPNIGLIGSYKIRADGQRRTRWKWALYLLYLVYLKKTVSKESFLWKACFPQALKNGYKLGESVLGGVYIFSYDCIKKIVDFYPYHNRVVEDRIYLTKISEDVIFSLLTFAAGFRLGDFGRPEDPLAIAQSYLPINKEEIRGFEKQIIHSLKKGLRGENQEELRAYFRGFRL